MRNTENSDARSADSLEPSRAWTVIGGGSSQDRRPGTAGASPEEEAHHEAQVAGSPPPLPVRPEVPPQPDSRGGDSAAPAPCFGGIPSPNTGEVEGDRSAERRPTGADGAPRKRGRGRPPRKWVVRVRAIDPQQYADFLRYLGHPCAGMKPEERMEDLSTLCARLWARTCEDMARQRHVAKDVNRDIQKKAA